LSILKHAKWNLIALLFTIISNLITIPFVVNKIGVSSFGRAGIVISIWTPLLLIGFILGQSAVKMISARLSMSDELAAQRAISTTFYFCVIFSAISSFIFLIINFFVLYLKPIDGHPFIEITLAASAIFFQQFVILFQSFASARQSFKFITKYTAFSSIITIFLIVAFVYISPSVIGYLLGIFLGFLVSAILWWVGLIKLQGPIIFRSYKIEALEVFKFFSLQSISQISGSFANQIDRYMLAGFSNIIYVGQYNIANRLQEALNIFVLKATEVTFPHFGKTANASYKERKNFYLMSSWLAVTLSSLTFGPLMALSYAAIDLWVGKSVGSSGGLLLTTLVAGGLVGSGSNVYTYFALGTGQLKNLMKISMVYSFATVGFTIVLILSIGPNAAGFGILLASIIRVILSIRIVKIYSFKDLKFAELIVCSILPIFITFTLAVAWSFFIPSIVFTWSRFLFIYLMISFSILFTILACSYMTSFGRAFIVKNLHNEILNFRRKSD
jgi:O-antigen/teichoic acid export membrane protein